MWSGSSYGGGGMDYSQQQQLPQQWMQMMQMMQSDPTQMMQMINQDPQQLMQQFQQMQVTALTQN